MTYFLMAILAIIPAIIWIRIFNHENPERKSTIFFAFLAGCTSTIPVFFYQKLFTSESTGNFIFFKAEAVNFQQNLSEMFGYSSLQMLTDAASDGTFFAALGLFAVFMGVGALEEIVKHTVVNGKAILYLALFALVIAGSYIASHFSLQVLIFVVGLVILYFVFLRLLKSFIQFQSIDDVIEVAIIAALGFSFVENIHYFAGKAGAVSTGAFAFFVIIRVTAVTVVHVLCSGVLAYHIGLAHFAHPVLEDEIREDRSMPITKFFHGLFQLPAEEIFKFEQIILGLVWAIGLHALYDFLMQLQFTVFGIPLFAVAIPLYFIGGLWYLFSLLEDKEDHKKFGKLVVKEDFVQL